MIFSHTGDTTRQGGASQNMLKAALNAPGFSASNCDAMNYLEVLLSSLSGGPSSGLVAKYHPQCPILSMAIPSVEGGTLAWRVEGDVEARQQLVIRGRGLHSSTSQLNLSRF